MQRADDLLLPVPEEVHVHIFSFLPSHLHWQLALVNSGFQRLALDEALWRMRYQAHYPEQFEALKRYGNHVSYYELTKGAVLFTQQSTSLNHTQKRKRDSHEDALEKIFSMPNMTKRSRSEPTSEQETEDNEKFLAQQRRDLQLLYTLLLTNNVVEILKFIAQLKKAQPDYLAALIRLPYTQGSHYRYFSLLHVAVEIGNLDIVKALANECSNEIIQKLFTQNKYHESVLHVALRKEHYQIVEFFLDDKNFYPAVEALINSNNQNNPLCMAIDSNNAAIIAYLIEKLKISANHYFQSIRLSIAEFNDYPHNPAKYALESMSAILYAASRGKFEAFNILAGLGADITLRDSAGNTALHLAVRSKNSTLVQHLEDMPELNTANRDGFTPIQLAANLGYTYINLFKKQNLTDLDYQDIFWNDWQVSVTKPARLRDVIALLSKKNVFATMPDGPQQVEKLIIETRHKSTRADSHVQEYKRILELLNRIQEAMELRLFVQAAQGLSIFSQASNQQGSTTGNSTQNLPGSGGLKF